jgi:hypothetical protein
MTGMSDQAYATKARDIMASIAENVVNRLRPEPKLAQVYSVSGNKAEVLFAGEVYPNTVTAKFPPYLTPQNPVLQTNPTNLAYAKPVTFNGTQDTSTVLQSGITDGDLTSANYFTVAGSANTWVQIDLGSVQTVDRIVVWHYYTDGRTFHGTKVQVSPDGTNWTTIFDSVTAGEYAEDTSGAGKTHIFPPQQVRYIRDWANGSTVSTPTHWVEIKAFNDGGRGDIVRVAGKPGNYYIDSFVSGVPKPSHTHELITHVQHTWGSASTNNTDLYIPWDSEWSDPYGFHQTNSTRLVCPPNFGGWYTCKLIAAFNTSGGAGWRRAGIWLNGGQVTLTSWHPAYTHMQSIAVDVFLNPGDYLEGTVYQDSGGFMNLHANQNKFSLYRIGSV